MSEFPICDAFSRNCGFIILGINLHSTPIVIHGDRKICMHYVTIQNGWNNRISYGCVYAQIRSGLGMHLVTYSNHDTVLFLLIVPIKGRFV